jgi:hypothetical protein
LAELSPYKYEPVAYASGILLYFWRGIGYNKKVKMEVYEEQAEAIIDKYALEGDLNVE